MFVGDWIVSEYRNMFEVVAMVTTRRSRACATAELEMGSYFVFFVCFATLSSRLQLGVRKLAAPSQKFWQHHKLESKGWRNNFAAHWLVDGAGWQVSLASVPQPMDRSGPSFSNHPTR
jgi:hypothetical protein